MSDVPKWPNGRCLSCGQLVNIETGEGHDAARDARLATPPATDPEPRERLPFAIHLPSEWTAGEALEFVRRYVASQPSAAGPALDVDSAIVMRLYLASQDVAMHAYHFRTCPSSSSGRPCNCGLSA